MTPGWSHFPHSADIGVRGTGPTLAVAFEQVACALFAIITDIAHIRPTIKLEIVCRAPDEKLLLVDWLNALIYEANIRNMVLGKFSVTIRNLELRGEAWGEAIDVARHEPAVEIKGATLTALQVERIADGTWVAQCVVDV